MTLMVVFRLGESGDYVTCPRCNSPKFFPSVMLKEKVIRWYSECENFYLTKEEIK